MRSWRARQVECEQGYEALNFACAVAARLKQIPPHSREYVRRPKQRFHVVNRMREGALVVPNALRYEVLIS